MFTTLVLMLTLAATPKEEALLVIEIMRPMVVAFETEGYRAAEKQVVVTLVKTIPILQHKAEVTDAIKRASEKLNCSLRNDMDFIVKTFIDIKHQMRVCSK